MERADIDWTDEAAPRSRRFGDVYFSREGGLEESRAVFLQGCGLPQAWRGRARFVVGELGFGTGLNILALLELWRLQREPGARLQIFSVEAFPLAREDAVRALGVWPELADLTGPLLAAWPAAAGFHRIDIPGLDASIDVAVMEAAEALAAWDGRADAWFLDGFSPSKNPQMWREEVLALIAARSAPGARAATFTVAGAVRRGLEAQGFSVAKRPGFGGKAERLEAVLPGAPAPKTRPRPPAVCIIGSGVAGAALARAFRTEGLTPMLIEDGLAGASGNPAALVTPRFDAGGGVPAQLYAQAFARAAALYDRRAPETVIARGVLQLEAAPRDQARFDKVALSELFAPGALERLAPEAAGRRLGEPCGGGGIWIRDGLVIEPAAALKAWLEGGERRRGTVARLEPAGGGWRVLGPDGEALCEAQIVFIAAGYGSAALLPELALQPVRGQASFAPVPNRPTAAAWGGYVVPTREGLLFGATHDRGQTGVEVREDDHRRNVELLAKARPALAAELDPASLDGRAGVRASTPDRLPLAGELRPGLFVLTGLGGRGFVLAPLLAEHLAARALNAPSPLPEPLGHALRPGRFGA
jgi:tRNA 5-methylaminomethyl-2-thiouridine biosynthesis bifunctional protein